MSHKIRIIKKIKLNKMFMSGIRKNIQPIIWTSYDIRAALGKEDLNLLCQLYDPKKFREGTRKIKRKLLEINPKCAACGNDNSKCLQGAHIIPVHRGGPTELKNLILLCSKKSTDGIHDGCHELFEQGFASISVLKRVRERWCNRVIVSSIRQEMINCYKKWETISLGNDDHNNDNFQKKISLQHWGKANQEVRRQLGICSPSTKKWFYLKLKLIEINRKRAMREGLKVAGKIVNDLKLKNGDMSNSHRAFFFYEYGMLSLINGQYKKAIDFFRKGEEVSEKSYEKISLLWLKLFCEIIIAQETPDWERIIEEKLEEAEILVERARGAARKKITPIVDHHDNRWYCNSLLDLVKVDILKGDFKKAENDYQKFIETIEGRNILNGWTSSASKNELLVYATLATQTAVTKDEAKSALTKIAPFIVERIKHPPREFPSGIRTALFCSARCLEIMGKDRPAERIKNVAQRIKDGTSFDYPYIERF